MVSCCADLSRRRFTLTALRCSDGVQDARVAQNAGWTPRKGRADQDILGGPGRRSFAVTEYDGNIGFGKIIRYLIHVVRDGAPRSGTSGGEVGQDLRMGSPDRLGSRT